MTAKTNKTGFSVRSSVHSMTLDNGSTVPSHGYRGFRISLANGYAVSVQFGSVNYCNAEARMLGPFIEAKGEKEKWLSAVCPDAEVAVLTPSGGFVRFKDGQEVRGHTTPDELAAILAWAAALDPKTNTTNAKEIFSP